MLGIGVNIASHPADTPYPATDLVVAGAAPIAPQALLERLLTAFAPLYDSWERAGFAALLPAWRRRAAGLGEAIEVRLERETLAGTFLDLEPRRRPCASAYPMERSGASPPAMYTCPARPEG